MTKITYLEHSGFLVEAEECAVIFDYYTGNIPVLPADLQLYVLASHKHRDHFNPEIFDLRSKYCNVTYILSHDIKYDDKGDYVHFVTPDETVNFPHFELKTTDSTDEGVSFLLRLSTGQTIYHAGDLNWWTWIGEESEADARLMEERFKKEVSKLAPYPIDIAFLPLDPRQQERYYWGFDYFMRNLNISLAFPMHFWRNDKIIDQLTASEYSAEYRQKIGALRKNGDFWLVK